MGIGAGVFLIALGAVLTFAVHVSSNNFNVHDIGVILMVVGAIGLLVDLAIFMPRRRRVTTYDDGYRAAPPATVRRTTTTTDDVY